MHSIIKFYVKVIILTAIVFSHFLSLAGERINKITIYGNKRVELSTIENYLGLKVGDQYSLLKEDQAIKRLYSTALFETIKMKISNGHLVVNVEETPFISQIDFKGNYKIRTSMLTKELLTQPGESLSKAKIQFDTEKIKEIYKRSGRFTVAVDTTIETQENNRVKVIFNISEGPKTGIRQILFAGNHNYRDSELRSVIMSKESKWFRFLETNDIYDPDRIEYDKELLKNFYQSLGFADFRVISAIAELNPTKEYFTLTFSLDEGEKYNFGHTTVDNKLANIDTKEIDKLISLKTGQIFDMKAVGLVAEKITENLASRGYPLVNVYPELDINNIDKVANIKFTIDKAERIFIGKINIEGNLKTEDKVIRREFKIAEGDIFNRSYIERGEQNLRNLDYFDKVSTKISPTNARDKYDVNIEVEEKSTSSIGLDLGYNTNGGPFGGLSFLERNLIGTGKYLTFGIQGGKKSTNYYAGITEPHFLDRDLSLGGNIFNNHTGRGGEFGQAEKNYTQKSTGLKTSLGYDIKEDLSHEIDYSIKRDHLQAPDSSSSRFLIEQIGKFTTSAITHTIIYDQTDSRIIPKNGYLVNFSQEYAGVGGNNKYLKHELEAKYFKSFLHNKLTLKLAASTGDIRGTGGKTVRISDRFNLGDYSLRGFSHGGVGPRDKETKEGLGGEKYYSLSTELNFPIGLPEEFNVTGAVFADLGKLWAVSLNSKSDYRKESFYNDQSLRASVGFGFIWITRFAPIRTDWAWPIKKKPYDDKQRFHLKFSTHF